MRRERCRALLLDLDGVLRRFDPARQRAVESEYGLPEGMLSDLAFAPERLRPAVLGAVPDAEWMAGVTDAVAAATEDPDRAARAVAAWREYRGEVVPEVLAAVREVRASGVPVALGTNATDRLDADLALLGLTGEVDAILNSSVLGHAKPSAEFFAAACARLDVPARLCLFVDDDDRNVRGARIAGLAGFRYGGPADLRYLSATLAQPAA
ncbi:HAD-IA family hydrolase [Actinocatenispora rupis]|uniref:Haloacid dehalogenase n=1 Tax=Actinocatenispora rupis TaxID=519421 RepID=A0A8J3JDA6_9ACTN|nr:HAD-IA family hydrolase [Actinocatenispora rupis]GID14352.1 haloacid dehalogenase [Actinocatenispora rupis]